MEDNLPISKKIEAARPRLGVRERLSMWNTIESTLPDNANASQPILSPFIKHSLLKQKYIMTPLVLLLMTLVGGGATAYASDSARPGDLLYPLERTIENVQLRMASTDEARNNLTKKLTQERVQELRDIIDEEITISPSNAQSELNITAIASTTLRDLEINVEAYRDTSVVEMNLAGQKFYFETGISTRNEVIVAIQEHFPILTDAQIDQALVFSAEDRESRPKDRGVVSLSKTGEARINLAVAELLKFLNYVDLSNDVNRKDFLATLATEVEGVTAPARVTREQGGIHIGTPESNIEIRVANDGNSRIDIRKGDTQVRVQEEAGEVSVRTFDDINDINDVSDIGSTLIDSTSTSVDIKTVPTLDFGVEANIFTDTTIIKIEFDGDIFYFETAARTRDEIITAITEHFPALSSEQIEAELLVTVKSRQSQPEDSGLEPVPSTVDTTTGSMSTSNTIQYEEGGRADEDREDDRRYEPKESESQNDYYTVNDNQDDQDDQDD